MARLILVAIVSWATSAAAQPANMSAAKFADHATVSNGDIITYTLVGTNNGPAAAVNPKLVDTLPSAVDLPTVAFLDGTGPNASPVTFSAAGNTATCTLTGGGTLAVGEAIRCRFTVRAHGIGNVTNNLVATNDLEDPSDTSNTGSATTFIQDPPPPTFAPTAIAFGSFATTASRAVIATNADPTVFLDVIGVAASCGAHAACAIAPDTCSATSITPLQTCSFTITATCLTPGAIAGTVQFTDYSSGSPESLPITGTCTAPPSPDFAISATTPSVTIPSGQSGHVGLAIAPSGGYTGAVALSCGDLPPHAVCAFAPATAMLAGSPVVVDLTIDTGGGAVVQSAARKIGGGRGAWLLIGVVGIFARRRRRGWGALVLLGFLNACGGAPAHDTPAGTYTVTVTASGSTNHATTIELVVK